LIHFYKRGENSGKLSSSSSLGWSKKYM